MAKERDNPVLAASLVDEASEVTLEELSVFCSVRRERIVALVEEGVLEPRGRIIEEWRFAAASRVRAAKALRLQRDLEIHDSALALVLDLLDRIEALRARLGSDERE
jgi:chaperone modulatory protein CbpM